MKPAAALIACLAVLSALPFLPALSARFISDDDDIYVTANPTVLAGLTSQGFHYAFTSTETANWAPLTWLSLMLDAQLYGDRPAGYHLTNILLHVASAIVLFGVVHRLLGRLDLAFLVAAVWAIHPMRVEPVAWVASRKDVLSTFLGLLAVYAYIPYARAPNPARMAATAALMALSLLAKSTFITLPALLLLLDYWPLGRTRFGPAPALQPQTPPRSLPALLLEKWPLWSLAIAAAAVSFWTQFAARNVAGLQTNPITQRLGNAALSYYLHLAHTFVPINLAMPYPPTRPWPLIMVLPAAVALLLITVAALWQGKRRPWLTVGWFWFVLALLPVCGLVQLGRAWTADRYSHIPAIGILLALAASIPPLSLRNPLRRSLFYASAAVVILVLATLSWRQTLLWRHGETLFRHTTAVTGPNLLAEMFLAVELTNHGQHHQAIPIFRDLLHRYPGVNDLDLHYNLGVALLNQHLKAPPAPPQPARNDPLLEEALGHFQTAIQITTPLQRVHLQARNNLAVTLARQEKYPQSAEQYRQLLELSPDYPGARQGHDTALRLAAHDSTFP